MVGRDHAKLRKTQGGGGHSVLSTYSVRPPSRHLRYILRSSRVRSEQEEKKPLPPFLLPWEEVGDTLTVEERGQDSRGGSDRGKGRGTRYETSS